MSKLEQYRKKKNSKNSIKMQTAVPQTTKSLSKLTQGQEQEKNRTQSVGAPEPIGFTAS